MQRPGTSLLVIDDDDKVRHSIAIHLEQCGFEVLQAGTARDGLTLMASEQPELVLCDLQIEDASMSGIDLLSRLGEVGPGTPAIVISADGVMSDVVEALRQGASDYLIRPQDDLEVLEHAVRRTLDRARLRNENERIRERLEKANLELENRLRELRDDQAAGRQVQLNMLPPSPWPSNDFLFEHRLLPSLYLSGDFVDYFRI